MIAPAEFERAVMREVRLVTKLNELEAALAESSKEDSKKLIVIQSEWMLTLKKLRLLKVG